jgi:ferredoxin
VKEVTALMMSGRGDELPVSSLPVDGTYPSGTAQWEKRNISDFVANWDPQICIQCGNCGSICPHSVIRAKLYPEDHLKDAPVTFKSAPIDARGLPDVRYTLQVYLEDWGFSSGSRFPIRADGAVARRARKAGHARGLTLPPGPGAWLDPLCDKSFVLSVLAATYVNLAPSLYLLALIATRELILIPLAAIYRFTPLLRGRSRYDFRAGLLERPRQSRSFWLSRRSFDPP